ncbi:hypothetical protein A2U01_0076453, partial [Trifolium medium]|nr:hypothetical protein [Trifolium medium]
MEERLPIGIESKGETAERERERGAADLKRRSREDGRE